jgi:hypothetical protein
MLGVTLSLFQKTYTRSREANSKVTKSMKLALAAFILSIIALGVAVSQPIWNLYSAPAPVEPAEPFLVLSSAEVHQFETFVSIFNDGNGDAHNVRIILAFEGGSNPMSVTDFVPEIANKTTATLSMPVGSFQLTYGGQDLSSYHGRVAISCKELSKERYFTFDVN